MPERAIPPLNEQQVDAVLAEALNRQLYETDVEGQLPEDFNQRLQDAQRLVVMAQQAYEAGSRNEDVAAMLFIAEVDMQPQAANQSGGEENVEAGMTMFDDNTLLRMEKALRVAGQADDDGDDMSNELTLVRAEIERRGLASPAPQTNGTAPAAPAGEAPAEDDATERAQLEDRLTIAAMRAHKVDPSEISTLSMETLRWIVDHPDGDGKPAAEESASDAAFSPPEGSIETTQVRAQAPTAPPAEPVHETTGGMSAAREALEEQLLGTTLKAYGRGRLQVPDIGDNELRFMIEHPDGRVTAEQLAAAKALDSGEAPASVPVAAEPAPEPEPVAAEPEVETPAPVAQAPEAPAESPAEPQAAVSEPVAEPEPETPAPVVKPSPPPAPTELHVPEEATRNATEHFEQTIAKEHLPLPPEITEEPPVLPFDMSKSSRDEIYSLHAKFHACEARIGFLITNQEDALGDLEKLRQHRELEVEVSIPVNVDGKKLTESQRASRVATDPQVQTYKTAEHNLSKELRKMKLLRDNYSRDVARTSRQMTRFMGEAEGA